MAVTFCGNETSANDATSLTGKDGNTTAFIDASSTSGRPSGASPETSIPGRTVSPLSVTLTVRTNPSRSIVTTGIWPVGISVTAVSPAPTVIVSAVNLYFVPPSSPTR